jgi:hypothetical protein
VNQREALGVEAGVGKQARRLLQLAAQPLLLSRLLRSG